MNYGKIKNENIIYCSDNYLKLEQQIIFNPTNEEYIKAGWYPIKYVEDHGNPEIKDNTLFIYTFNKPKLEILRDRKIDGLYKYDSSSEINEFTLNGIKMWVKLEDRKNMKQSLDVLEDEEEWTYWYNLIPITFKVKQFKEMLKQVERYALLCKNQTFQHEYNIKRLSTIEEIENYNYKLGYPNKLDIRQ